MADPAAAFRLAESNVSDDGIICGDGSIFLAAKLRTLLVKPCRRGGTGFVEAMMLSTIRPANVFPFFLICCSTLWTMGSGSL
ncbi:MAG: hypothetical protein R3C59_27895 [Planctomycetaceae bacterium]